MIPLTNSLYTYIYIFIYYRHDEMIRLTGYDSPLTDSHGGLGPRTDHHGEGYNGYAKDSHHLNSDQSRHSNPYNPNNPDNPGDLNNP